MGVLDGMEPVKVFEFFEAISDIPRTSGHTDGISRYLEKFAGDRGLDHLRDQSNNVIIRKKASAGKENAPTVILQGHMDMVGDKMPGSDHDFLKDPLKLKDRGRFHFRGRNDAGRR